MNRHHENLRARMAQPRADPAALKRVAERLAESPGADVFTQMQLLAIDPLTQLHGCDLSGFDLHRVDLAEADLRETVLSRADLTHARLSGADLSGADLKIARLELAKLVRAKLTGADLRQTNLRKADLRGADLTDARLGGSALLGARLEGTALAEDLGDFTRLISSPRHLLSHWPGSDAFEAEHQAWREHPDPKPPLLWDQVEPLAVPKRALHLLIDAILRVMLEALVLRNSGIDLNRYKLPGVSGLFVPHLFRTNEEIAEMLEPQRHELMAERRERARGGKPLAAAENAVRLGDLNLLSRNFEEADQFYRMAYEICRTERRGELISVLHGRFGCLALDRVDRVRAIRHLSHSLEVCTEIGHAEGKVRALLSLSALALLFGDTKRAGAYLQQAGSGDIAFDREHLHPRRRLIAGAIGFRTGDVAASLEAWERARSALRDANMRADVAAVMKLEEIGAKLA